MWFLKHARIIFRYAMKLLPTCGALFSVNYAQCSLMRLFVSWLVTSQSFASLHFALSMITTCASKTLKLDLPYESTIPTNMRYFHVVLRKFACAISNFQNKILFCVFVSLAEQWGVAIIFHARCIILTISVYSLVIARE